MFNPGWLSTAGSPFITTSWERGARYFRVWAKGKSAIYQADPLTWFEAPRTILATLVKVTDADGGWHANTA